MTANRESVAYESYTNILYASSTVFYSHESCVCCFLLLYCCTVAIFFCFCFFHLFIHWSSCNFFSFVLVVSCCNMRELVFVVNRSNNNNLTKQRKQRKQRQQHSIIKANRKQEVYKDADERRKKTEEKKNDCSSIFHFIQLYVYSIHIYYHFIYNFFSLLDQLILLFFRCL